MAGRKSKYTPETVARITQAVELGATQELACHYGGISQTTFHEWMNRKPEFAEAVKAAEGRAAVKWLARIEKAAQDGTWQAAAWKLERRYPHAYGRAATEQRGSVAADHDGTVRHDQRKVDLSGFSEEEIDSLYEIAARHIKERRP